MGEEAAIKVDGMGPVHHIVLLAAVEGDPLSSPLQRWVQTTYSGEEFVLVEPQPLAALQQASIDVVRADFAVLGRDDEAGRFSAEEAMALLSDEETWTDYSYGLIVTEAGEEAFRSLHERYGDAYRKAVAVAERRDAEFLERHPEHPQRQGEYLDALSKWVETGGEKPQRPRYDDEPPPYHGDVPRYLRPN